MSELREGQTVNDRRVLGYSVIGSPADGESLVFDDAIKKFKWVTSASGGMSSEQFLQDKIIAGDSFQVSGDINLLNDSIIFIVPNGKTAFLIEAKIVSVNHIDPPTIPGASGNTINDNRVEAALVIDSLLKDKANVGTVMSASKQTTTNGAGGQSGTGNQNGDPFNVKMLSLIGDGIKTIEIINLLDNGTAFATMSGYVIDTV